MTSLTWWQSCESAGAEAAGYPDMARLVAGIAAGDPAPDTVLACAGSAAAGDAPRAARVAAAQVLGVVQEFLSARALRDARLIVVTRGAAAVRPGEGVADLAGAAVAGLVRSAQTENPGRLVLADRPAGDGDGSQLAALLTVAVRSGGSGPDEPELALRDGAVFARRLARLETVSSRSRRSSGAAGSHGGLRNPGDAPGVTGGTGSLGGLTARHLAATGRARQVLLASRSGSAAPGAARLAAEIAATGAGVRVVAC